jgi:hypothetical protein
LAIGCILVVGGVGFRHGLVVGKIRTVVRILVLRRMRTAGCIMTVDCVLCEGWEKLRHILVAKVLGETLNIRTRISYAATNGGL